VKPDHPQPAGQRGFALIIVLWSLVLLTLIATQLTAGGRAEARLASNLRGAAIAAADADGLIYEAAASILMNASTPWPPDPAPRTERLSGARAVITVGTDDGKFDLNSVPADTLAQLLGKLGIDGQQAQQLALDIALWRFPSAQTNERQRAYMQAGKPYGPPGAPFQSVSELALVIGMTPEILARLQPHVTIYHEGDPDPRAADPIVLAVLAQQGAILASATRDNRSGGIAVIDVQVETDAGSTAHRHAVIRIGAQADRGGWRILAWQ
jgi:general secretion pathway protein K